MTRNHMMGAVALVGMGIALSVLGLQRQIVPSTEMPPVLGAVALFCGLVVVLIRVDSWLAAHDRPAAAFAFLALFVLSASSALHLANLHGSTAPAREYAWEGGHLGELARLSAEYRYWMDGALDEWLYVLFVQGLSTVPYGHIPVLEKGLLYFYATLLRLAGDFNTYLLVVASCAAQVISAWLLLRIASLFAPARVAFAAALLLIVMPDALYWGALIHKDSFVVALLLLCLWSGYLAFATDALRWGYAALFAAALAAVAFSRSGLVLPLILGGLIAIAFSRKPILQRAAAYCAAIVTGAAVLAAILPAPVSRDLRSRVLDRVYQRVAQGSSYQLDVQNITFTTTAADSLVYRLSGGDLNWKKLHYVPVRVAMYFIAPFPPWPIRSAVDRFLLPATWILVPLWFFALRGGWDALRRRSPAAVWTLSYFAVVAVAIAFAGGFVHERYRVLLMPFFLAFAALGEGISTARQKIALLVAAALTFVIGLVAYAALK